jgi:hypothetical protein
MSTLWQRFGRGGRNRKLEAIGIFLVEKEHFDEEKARKAEKKAQKMVTKKRKQKKSNEGPSSPRKQVRTSGSQTTVLQVRQHPNQELEVATGPRSVQVESDSGSSDSESNAEMSEQLNERYTALPPVNQSKTRKKRRVDRDVDPAMDDLINAKSRGLPCRCKPSNAYFQNNKASE